ncbi:MAG: BCCT family transporter, partial [Muribaculaceae bacterium]|nr:BCCT family transporter [Muribaculaceae bacterium]
VAELGTVQMWAPTFTLFHWGPLAWGFYVILAVCFAFMIHVRRRPRQRFSEACRPLFGNSVDGGLGKIIDIIAIFAIVCATATTFSLATPLLTKAMGSVFGFEVTTSVTIIVLLLIFAIYTYTVLFGVKGISRLAEICSYLFFAILFYFLFLGGETRYILETGFQSMGNLAQNFIGMATYMDPVRENGFAQNWTVYYWAYWLVWCVATPFFIAIISKGRTLRNVVYGTFGWGLAGTYLSFIILGGYGLAQQIKHGVDSIGYIANGGEMYDAILMIFDTLPLPAFALILLVITMIAFYSTTLDGITYVTSSYSYTYITPDEEPSRKIRAFWSVMLILLPIALLFAENSLYSLQGVTIIAAFPIGLLLILIVISFFKDVNNWLKNK